MSAEGAAYSCANPLCGKDILADQAYSIELLQRQPDGSRSHWHLCNLNCAIQFTKICGISFNAAAERKAMS
jgi:hypothetical protein